MLLGHDLPPDGIKKPPVPYDQQERRKGRDREPAGPSSAGSGGAPGLDLRQMAEGAVQHYVVNQMVNGVAGVVDKFKQGGGQPQPENQQPNQDSAAGGRRVINLEAFEED